MKIVYEICRVTGPAGCGAAITESFFRLQVAVILTALACFAYRIVSIYEMEEIRPIYKRKQIFPYR